MEEMEERGEGERVEGEGGRETKGEMGGKEEMGDVEVEEVMGGEGEACTCTEAEGGRGCVDGEVVEGGGGGEAEGGAKGVWLDKESSQERSRYSNLIFMIVITSLIMTFLCICLLYCYVL